MKFNNTVNLEELSCIEKQLYFTHVLNALPTKEAFYQTLISLGKEPSSFPLEKTPDLLVRGCQSELYLACQLISNKLFFYATSEAFISMGMAKLFLLSYSGETIQTIFSTPPIFSQQLQFYSSISLGRQQGMEALFLKMKLEAVQAQAGRPSH